MEQEKWQYLSQKKHKQPERIDPYQKACGLTAAMSLGERLAYAKEHRHIQRNRVRQVFSSGTYQSWWLKYFVCFKVLKKPLIACDQCICSDMFWHGSICAFNILMLCFHSSSCQVSLCVQCQNFSLFSTSVSFSFLSDTGVEWKRSNVWYLPLHPFFS